MVYAVADQIRIDAKLARVAAEMQACMLCGRFFFGGEEKQTCRHISDIDEHTKHLCSLRFPRHIQPSVRSSLPFGSEHSCTAIIKLTFAKLAQLKRAHARAPNLQTQK